MPTNFFRNKKTGEIFRTNYIDYFNGVIAAGDYSDPKTKLLKDYEVEEVYFVTPKHAQRCSVPHALCLAILH